MARQIALVRRLAFAIFFAVAGFYSTSTLAANVQFVGTVGYSHVGSTAVLTADGVRNVSSGGISGTLRMELWAFPSPFNGSFQIGYKLAQYSLGQLLGGFIINNVNSGLVPFALPPNGSWVAVMLLTEFDNGPVDGGYSTREWVNFANPLIVGPPLAPGQLAFSAISLNFGNVAVGSVSPPQTIVVTNVGGVGVSIASAGSTNTLDFAASTNCPTFLLPGATCLGTATFSPHTSGPLSGAVVITSDGAGSPQIIQLTGNGVSTSPPGLTTALAIEYRHAAFDHYFVTAIADEITKLDNGTFVGWARTGQSFKVYTNSAAGLAAVCRFFSTSFAPKSSHFYTPDAPECAVVQTNPNWLFEAIVFYMTRADINGNCAAGTQQVYRLYNNGQGAAPNHRYTTSLAIRSTMLGQGWIPEGYGPIGVIMCAPL